MMKYIIYSIFFTQYSFSNILVKDLYLNFEDSLGKGSFEQIIIPGEERGKSEFDVEVSADGDTSIKIDDAEVNISFLKSYIAKVQKLVIESLSIHNQEGEKAGISLKHIFGRSVDDKNDLELIVNDLDFQCDQEKGLRSDLNISELLKKCLDKGDGTLHFLNYDSAENNVGLENAKIKILNNHFNFEMKLKASLSGKVKINGEVHLINEDSTLRIDINSAKLGIFGIKNKLLSMIKDQGLERVTVEGSSIYIALL